MNDQTRDAWMMELAYAREKWPDETHDELFASEGIGGQFEGDLLSYWGRAKTYGPSTPQGREALRKAAVVAVRAWLAAERAHESETVANKGRNDG